MQTKRFPQGDKVKSLFWESTGEVYCLENLAPLSPSKWEVKKQMLDGFRHKEA